MESGIQSSFIPRDAAAPERARSYRSGGLGDLLLVLGIVAVVASGALAGGVFLYQQYLTTQEQSDVASLKRSEQQFEPSLVEQLIRLDDRLNSAQSILTAHIAPSVFFDILNQVTLKSVAFSDLTLDATNLQQIQVKMDGIAQSVNSIALENDVLSKSGVFASPIFSNIDRQKDGVHFQLTALVKPSALNFENLTGGSAQPAQTPDASTVQSQTQSTSTPASDAQASTTQSSSGAGAPPPPAH